MNLALEIDPRSMWEYRPLIINHIIAVHPDHNFYFINIQIYQGSPRTQKIDFT